MPICLQIGDVRSLLFEVPKYGETLRISLPECYRGLPLKAEPLDANQTAYNDPNVKLDDMWPCVLTRSNSENATKIEVNTKILSDLPSNHNDTIDTMKINETIITN